MTLFVWLKTSVLRWISFTVLYTVFKIKSKRKYKPYLHGFRVLSVEKKSFDYVDSARRENFFRKVGFVHLNALNAVEIAQILPPSRMAVKTAFSAAGKRKLHFLWGFFDNTQWALFSGTCAISPAFYIVIIAVATRYGMVLEIARLKFLLFRRPKKDDWKPYALRFEDKSNKFVHETLYHVNKNL